jgi:hypothetical protein
MIAIVESQRVHRRQGAFPGAEVLEKWLDLYASIENWNEVL